MAKDVFKMSKIMLEALRYKFHLKSKWNMVCNVSYFGPIFGLHFAITEIE